MIDLGDRAFTVLHLPGHSPDSIGLLRRGDAASCSRATRSTTARCSTPAPDADIDAYVDDDGTAARASGRGRARRPRAELRPGPPRRAVRRVHRAGRWPNADRAGGARPCARRSATSSQSCSVNAGPMPTVTERAARSSVRGHRPGPYSTSVGCSAQCHGPPLPDAVRRATSAGFVVDGLAVVHLRGRARPRRAARRPCGARSRRRARTT